MDIIQLPEPQRFTIGFEGISILAAKSIEWARPGVGYIELSTRYVDMSGKDLYPVENEFRIAGVSEEMCKRVASESQRCFEIYKDLEGSGYDGPLPRFFAERYGDVVPAGKLTQGIIGEVCDLLGNLLPCSTLTSLGGSFSGESLPSLIQHLHMDMLPETAAIADAIIAEAKNIGANQFLRHLEVTAWQEDGWTYLSSPGIGDPPSALVADLPPGDYVERALTRAFNARDSFPLVKLMRDVITHLTSLKRGEYDKLPREFEAISVAFYGQMSFRGHRDLQRMGFSTHKRGYVSSQNGFYDYTKPAPQCLTEAFEKVMMMSFHLEIGLLAELARKNLGSKKALMQYPLALGNNVPFFMAGNLRQMEFCGWQRSKPSVNHEVREVFLSFERKLREAYPWWGKISRADVTPAYVFARGDSDIPLSKVV